MKPLNFTEKTANEPLSKELSWDQFNSLKVLLISKKNIPITIIGKSMLPLIKEGNVVDVESINSILNLKRFDIIIFWQHDKLICHYFWRMNDVFQHKNADGNEKKILVTKPLNPIRRSDQPITEEQILGIVKNYHLSQYLKIKVLWKSLQHYF